MAEEEEPVDLLARLAKRSRDWQALLFWGVLLAGSLWLLTDNRRIRTWWAEMSGVPELTAKVDLLAEKLDTIDAKITAQMEASADYQGAAAGRGENINQRLERVEELVRQDTDPAPAIEFVSGSKISDGRIGGLVTVTWRFKKLRNCGKSIPDDFFVDINGVTAHFTAVSILDSEGRGLGLVADDDIKSITYTAVIPADKGITPGRASGYVSVAYDDSKCPAVLPVISPGVTFDILPEQPDKD